ncbi:hypothetical protein FS837_011344 [Tulasnella sp. UAMH 9824]|nr:hypothetical protein FS837_011344 [Tulasnella sp. UAMH 9824]
MTSPEGFDTEYSADSVEFCPHPDSLDIFVCGTYQLQEETADRPRRRLGRCYLFETSEDGVLSELQRFNLPAILDMKWSHRPRPEGSLLAIADAEGCIRVHRLSAPEVAHRTLLANPTSLIDSASVANGSNESIVTSTSDGCISVVGPEDGEMTVTETWKAHDFEPWIAAWDYWSERQIIYSGGDDCKMKGWDLRQGTMTPTFTNKNFEAGVTTIQSHPFEEHVLAVGSYDSTVRLFDTRKPLRPFVQMDVGGGAWRVKWHPSAQRRHDILVACMHDGFKVLRTSGTQEEPVLSSSGYEVLKRFDEHKSLAYGVDWSYKEGHDSLIASCSFYDHLLRTWKA